MVALAASGLAANRLELEISESWVMEGPFRAEKQMRSLSRMGISIVIDDFGLANVAAMLHKRLFRDAVRRIRQRAADSGADAEGFADALDIGAAI